MSFNWSVDGFYAGVLPKDDVIKGKDEDTHKNPEINLSERLKMKVDDRTKDFKENFA